MAHDRGCEITEIQPHTVTIERKKGTVVYYLFNNNMQVDASEDSEHEDAGEIEVKYNAEGPESDKEIDVGENDKLVSLAIGTDGEELFEGEEIMEAEAMHQEVEGFVDADKEGHGSGDELEEGQGEAKEVED
jgi:hypothetical protein